MYKDRTTSENVPVPAVLTSPWELLNTNSQVPPLPSKSETLSVGAQKPPFRTNLYVIRLHAEVDPYPMIIKDWVKDEPRLKELPQVWKISVGSEIS